MYVHTLYIIYLLYTRTDAEYDVGILYGGYRARDKRYKTNIQTFSADISEWLPPVESGATRNFTA